jgi:DNA-binding XRE family transcriptional regulator
MQVRRESLTIHRQRAGWSKKELARRAGINDATVVIAERGGGIRESTAKKIADALRVDISEIVVLGQAEAIRDAS